MPGKVKTAKNQHPLQFKPRNTMPGHDQRNTHHGLRRSFSLLGESAGAPAGAIAQVMGHKPSAIAEGYRPGSVGALRPFLAKIEAHILQEAGIVFDAKAEPGALRVVAG